MKARKSYLGRLRFCHFFMVMMVMLVVGTKQRSCCCYCCRSWSYCCCCCCCRCCVWSSQADIRALLEKGMAEGEGNKGKGGSGKEKEEGEAQDEDGQQWWNPPGASHGWMDDANVGERRGWLEGGGRTEEAKQGGQEGWRRRDWMPACDTCGMMWMMQMRQRWLCVCKARQLPSGGAWEIQS